MFSVKHLLLLADKLNLHSSRRRGGRKSIFSRHEDRLAVLLRT